MGASGSLFELPKLFRPQRRHRIDRHRAPRWDVASEHGNENDPALDVGIEVVASLDRLSVRVTDNGGDKVIPETATPDIEAKLAGEQTPRGWGLFLTAQMVDEVNTSRENGHHIVELVMSREGDPDVR